MALNCYIVKPTKINNMKFKLHLLMFMFTFFALFSCQEDETQVNEPEEEEIIDANSTLASLMQNTSASNGAMDNILDDSSCISVSLPVSVMVNDITITINTYEDLALIEQLFNEFDDDEDDLDFLFPITIVLNDYTQITINNEDELEDFVEDCMEEPEVIECVDFQYPITFSMYNTDFQDVDTTVIESDQQLYLFLDNLGDDSQGAVLASLNFPITLIYANGETLQVNNNQQLEEAINAAEQNCDDDDDECTEETLDMYLQECYWNIVSYNNNDQAFYNYDFYFNENGSLEIVNGDTTVAIGGDWSTSVSDNGGVILSLTELTAFQGDLGGNWLVLSCDDDHLQLQRINDSTPEGTVIVMEQECEDELDCSVQEINENLQECYWVANTNLFNNIVADHFYFNNDGLVTVTDLNGNTQLTGTWDITLSDEGAMMVLQLPQPYNMLSEVWTIVDCDDDSIEMVHGEDTLVFEQVCEEENPFECFEEMTLTVCDEGEFDGTAIFNLVEPYMNCPALGEEVELLFYLSYSEAEMGGESINSSQFNYTNTSNPQTLYVRVQQIGSNNFEIFELYLFVEDCSTESCSEFDVDSYLMECHWIPVSINGSGDFNSYDFYFNDNQSLVIEGNGTTVNGVWTTYGSNNGGVIVNISQLTGPTQQFIGEWLVVECGMEQFVFTNTQSNVQMMLERECN